MKKLYDNCDDEDMLLTETNEREELDIGEIFIIFELNIRSSIDCLVNRKFIIRVLTKEKKAKF